jgi:hypothetical protein
MQAKEMIMDENATLVEKTAREFLAGLKDA